MACENCSKRYAGALIKIDSKGLCMECGAKIGSSVEENLKMSHNVHLSKWDKYFLTICKAVASKSPCISRQIGAIIVRDKSIISTGYNGPARGFPHCNTDGVNECPRRSLGYQSGEGLEHCPAAHAETNAVANAARVGVSVLGATMYLNTVIPCKFCAVSIVNAGIKEVVAVHLDYYHAVSQRIFLHGDVNVRSFNL